MKIPIKCPCGNIKLLTPSKISEKHGKYCSRTCTFKYRDNSKFLSMIKISGENHPNWKGDGAGYKAFHLRVNLIRGKAKICKKCGSERFCEWANLTGDYSNVFDYDSLCRKCHHKLDDIANRTAKKVKELYGNKHILKGWETRRKFLAPKVVMPR